MQQQNSKTDFTIDFEPGFRKDQEPEPEPIREGEGVENVAKTYPWGLVMKACPEIADYAVNGIGSWREYMGTAAQVRGYLGISPSAFEDALDVLGQESTAIVIACMLQRSETINSAGVICVR